MKLFWLRGLQQFAGDPLQSSNVTLTHGVQAFHCNPPHGAAGVGTKSALDAAPRIGALLTGSVFVIRQHAPC